MDKYTKYVPHWFKTQRERDMDHKGGIFGTLISITSAFIAWINIENAQIILTLLASLVAIVSGGFAARYYFYAAKEKIKNLRK